MKNTNTNESYISRQTTLNRKLERMYATKITLGNGVTPEMVSEAVHAVMAKKGSAFGDMTAEEMANAVNCYTACCCKMCA